MELTIEHNAKFYVNFKQQNRSKRKRNLYLFCKKYVVNLKVPNTENNFKKT